MRTSFGRRLILTTTLVFLVAGRSDANKSTDSIQAPQPTVGWDSFAEQFLDDTHRLLPHIAVRKGRHEYDGVQTDYSAEGIEARIQHFQRSLEQAEKFEPSNPDEAFDRDLLVWYAEQSLFQLERAAGYRKNITTYFGAISPDIYASRDYAPLPVRLKALIKHTGNIPNLTSQMRDNLESPLPRSHVKRGLSYFAGLTDFYELVIPDLFDAVENPDLQRQLAESTARAVHALRETRVWLQAQQDSATDSFQLGATLFLERLRAVDGLQVSLQQFKGWGEDDLARNLTALKLACTQLNDKLTLEQCVAKVKQDKPKGGSVVRAREQLTELREFVETQELVSIPSADVALVAAAPPHRRANLAYISLRGAFDPASVPSTYFVAPPDPSWSKEEQLAYMSSEAELMFISAHEVWPGHFLHSLHLAAAPSQVRRLLTSGGYKEGWAHYAEEMMWEQGFQEQNPAAQIGQILNALRRNVRYLCSVGMHAEQLSVTACEKMFREQGFQDPGNARQQAARGTYDPGYYSYTLHKLLIQQARDRWEGSLPDFHNRLMSFGAPPVPVVAPYLAP